MRILDETGKELQRESIDNSKGYLLIEEIVSKHHEAVEAVEEQGHYEVVREYPNGGKDVEWVVDVPGIEAKDAYDEFETIERFVKYTERQLAENHIEELKQNLRDTDYIILKVVEGAASLSEISGTISKRSKWRKEINELEDKLKEYPT